MQSMMNGMVGSGMMWEMGLFWLLILVVAALGAVALSSICFSATSESRWRELPPACPRKDVTGLPAISALAPIEPKRLTGPTAKSIATTIPQQPTHHLQSI